jgi:hypothetical protein
MPWTNDPQGGLSALPANAGSGFISWTSFQQGPFFGSIDGENNLVSMVGANPLIQLNIPTYYTAAPFYNSTGSTYEGLSSSETSCFSMSAAGANSSISCYRKLISPLMLNGNLEVRVGINYRNGFKGVFARKNNIRIFGFVATDNEYQTYNGSAYANVPIAYHPDSVFFISILRTLILSTDSVIARVTRPKYDGSTPVASIVETANLQIDELEFIVEQTDLNGPVYENSLFFNYLTGYSAYR